MKILHSKHQTFSSINSIKQHLISPSNLHKIPQKKLSTIRKPLFPVRGPISRALGIKACTVGGGGGGGSKRVHLVCFRLRSHGPTPAAYDLRLVTSRMNQRSYSFRVLADRRLGVSSLLHSVSNSPTLFVALPVPLLPCPHVTVARESRDSSVASHRLTSSLPFTPFPHPSLWRCCPRSYDSVFKVNLRGFWTIDGVLEE